MQTIEIRLWDDVEAKAGRRVQADVQVTLEVTTPKGTERRVLDLTAEHLAELGGMLAPWLAAGRDPDAPAIASAHKAGSKEAREFYAGLREWAKSAGRDGEHWTSGKNGRERQLYYPRQMVADYQEYLLGEAQRQAS
jgi:hypothetical protein